MLLDFIFIVCTKRKELLCLSEYSVEFIRFIDSLLSKVTQNYKKLAEVITDSQIFENKRIHFRGILRALNLEIRNRRNVL